MKTVLILNYNLRKGGAERIVVELANGLAKRYKVILCNITVYNPYNSYVFDVSKDVKLLELNCKSGLNPLAYIKVATLIHKLKPHIVHCHCDMSLIFVPLVLNKRSTKFIHTLHNVAEEAIRFKGLKSLYRYFYEYHVTSVVISQFCQNTYADFYGLQNSILIVNSRSKMELSDKISFVETEILNLKPVKESKVFIHVARFAPRQKNHILLFNSFIQLKMEYREIVLLVVGEGYGEMSAELKIEYSKADIFFIGSKINVADYLYFSDYFVLSSIFEGLPVSLIESMSFGLIPICTPAGGIVDVIDESSNIGYISAGFTQEDYYKSLRAAYLNEKNINPIDVVDFYNENFSFSNFIDAHQQLYETS